MTLQPLLNASLAIQLHVLTVLPAAILGVYMFWARKGTPRHRMLGKVWLLLMVASAFSSFFIHEIRMWGEFSPIHLISIGVIVAAVAAINSARRHRIQAHKRAVTAMYLGGILGAGVFTLWPGRMMNKLLLGDLAEGGGHATTQAILAAACVVAMAYGVNAWLGRRPRRVSKS
jgi:uncharacterized membrane protein